LANESNNNSANNTFINAIDQLKYYADFIDSIIKEAGWCCQIPNIEVLEAKTLILILLLRVENLLWPGAGVNNLT